MHTHTTPMPPCLPGFESINRYWDKRNNCYTAKLLPGEYYVTEQEEMITTVLGSCISVCVYSPPLRMGGMNHFMLPSSELSSSEIASASFRFGDVAMERMINDLLRRGAEKSDLQFKAFGAGNVLRNHTDIGRSNIDFLNAFMKLEGYRLLSSDLGDIFPRKVNFYPKTGKVMMKRLQSVNNDTIFTRETQYRKTLDTSTPDSGEIDLF